MLALHSRIVSLEFSVVPISSHTLNTFQAGKRVPHFVASS